MKKKIVKVRRHERSDGSVVEAHDRTIDISEPKSLSEYIKKKKAVFFFQDALWGNMQVDTKELKGRWREHISLRQVCEEFGSVHEEVRNGYLLFTGLVEFRRYYEFENVGTFTTKSHDHHVV